MSRAITAAQAWLNIVVHGVNPRPSPRARGVSPTPACARRISGEPCAPACVGLGTGLRPAAMLLAEHFDRVVATDLRRRSCVTPLPMRGHRRVPGSFSGLPDRSCDPSPPRRRCSLDLQAFYREARRAEACRRDYFGDTHERDPDIDAVLHWFEYERVGSYWPEGRESRETSIATCRSLSESTHQRSSCDAARQRGNAGS